MDFLKKLKTNNINQNGYHRNTKTLEKIGVLFSCPLNFIPNDCLPCDGFVLAVEDYSKLYAAIGNSFNTGNEAENEFRIPDYNITGNFLQPGANANVKIAAGLPNITGRFDGNGDDGAARKTGCFYQGAAVSGSNGVEGGYYIYFDASRSNAIYGKSTTVQPPSQTIKVCIKYK